MNIDNKLILENSRYLNILYVEDDNELRDTTAQVFENFFNTVDTAVNGEDGIKKYKQYFIKNEFPYDVVISDINMPIMNGIDMCIEMKKICFEQVVAFITAFNEIEYLHKAIDLGISGFLTKPIQIEQLKKVLYSISQMIADRKLIKIYYEKIENLNMELQSKNDELMKSQRVLNTITKRETLVKEHVTKKKEKSDDYIKELEAFKAEELNYIEEIYHEIDSNIIKIVDSIDGTNVDLDALEIIFSSFKKYIFVISVYPFFTKLSQALNSFISTIEHKELPDDAVKVKDIFMILESFVFVLGNFHKELAQTEISNINQLDASIINDINTVTIMWLNKSDDEVDYGEMEFF